MTAAANTNTQTKKKKKSGGSGQTVVGTLAALIILMVVLTIVSRNFLTYSNLMSVLKQTAFTALTAIGMLFALITAGIDLSVGANATFCACMMGMLVQRGVTNSFVLIIVAIGCGLGIGLVNGSLLTRLHLPHPFVSTLGMKNILWGAALFVTGSQMVSGFPDGVTWLGSATIGGFPVCFILVIILYIIFHIVLTRTKFGRSIYCAGGNMEATRLSGINSANVLTICYVISGFTAALAGIVSVGRSGICNGANAIQPYDTDAIAAAVLGGASFMGGKGTMLGTLLGALIIAVLRNGFSLLSVESSVQNMVLGAVIIGAVLLDVVRDQQSQKQRRLAAAAAVKE